MPNSSTNIIAASKIGIRNSVLQLLQHFSKGLPSKYFEKTTASMEAAMARNKLKDPNSALKTVSNKSFIPYNLRKNLNIYMMKIQ